MKRLLILWLLLPLLSAAKVPVESDIKARIEDPASEQYYPNLRLRYEQADAACRQARADYERVAALYDKDNLPASSYEASRAAWVAAETARDAAFKVNAIGPRNLALACEKVNARLIHISTDYVFPGTANGGVALDECAVPAPISAYGQTKLLGEQYVERFCRRHFIVRTAWLYSSYGKNFVKTMIRLGRTHDKITVVNDQLGNPTNAVDLAYHILKLAVSHDYGIYHCTGNGICSWYDFACAIMQGAGLSCKVEPVTSAEYAAANPASASRPAWSALDNRMLRCTVGDEMRDWQDALHDFFANWNGEL